MLAEPRVRVISIAAISRPNDGAILAMRCYDPARSLVFYRPLGGAVEFGESTAETVRRELLEEIDREVIVGRRLGVLENVFVYDGRPGHEIIFVWQADFADAAAYLEETFTYQEDSGLSGDAIWVYPDKLASQGIPLFPTGLTELLKRR
ncbi:MAG: NUDIX domain-containing protein [Caldilinea sp.]|nr:NUDIX domain-containing protein [Caldilinea sp.]